MVFAESIRYWPDSLQWLPSLNIGYFPCHEYCMAELGCSSAGVYNAAYLAKYDQYASTEMGLNISKYRWDLISKYSGPPSDEVFVLDIGCGNGQFINTAPSNKYKAYGYDINPAMVSRLKAGGKYLTPTEYGHHNRWVWARPKLMTFWDSFEHIPDLNIIKNDIQRMNYVFISLPTFETKEEVLTSKHFRMDEHYWYFSVEGLKMFMKAWGFGCIICWPKEDGGGENALGREGISTFVFSNNRR